MSQDAREDAARKKLADAEARLQELQGDLDAEKARIEELQRLIGEEKVNRKTDRETPAKLKDDIAAVQEDKKSLEAELALIVDQIGFLSEYSTKKPVGS